MEYRGTGLTFGELDLLSDRVARTLVEQRLADRAVVATAMLRGIDWAVGVLGIFKARAAYLPLDPRHPRNRLDGILRQSGCRLVLVDAIGEDTISPLLQGHALCDLVRLDGASVPGEKAALPLFADHPGEELAYVLFTSGSTGAPKGAMIPQEGLVNNLRAKIELLEMNAADRVAQTAAATSDMSLWQLLCPFLVGGRAHIFDDDTVREPAALHAALAAAGITILDTVPSLLRLFLEHTDASGASLPSLRYLVVGGEVLDPELCRTWLARFPDVPIVNCYGPTECSDGVTHEWIATPPASSVARISIGRPIANVQAYIVDPDRRDLVERAPGQIGELVLAGHAVGLGYVGDPERSARVFGKNPLSSDPRFRRTYRTGDLARMLPDGRIDFHGRTDHQVQVRGHRVEPGEIESCLLAHPSVAGCAVLALPARTSSSATNRARQMLVAYLETTAVLTVEELRDHLSGYLPAYMIPERFVSVDRLPLTANGKIDRNALPDPSTLRPVLGTPYIAPRAGIEQHIAAAWARLLDLDRVGASDNFLALGGDSLLASSAINLIASQTGHSISFAQMLTMSVRELAGALEAARSEPGRPPALVAGGDRRDTAPLSPSQDRYWVRVQRDPEYTADHLVSVLRLRGPLDVAALSRALQEIVRRHEPLRTSFRRNAGGEPVQQVHTKVELDLPRHDLRALAPQEREQAVREQSVRSAARPFDFHTAPLFRAALFELEDEHHVLGLVMHHIVSDGWSWGVLTRELSALYNAFRAGRPAPLDALPIGYADYARWAHNWLASDDARREMDYWRRHLDGAPTTLAIPTDRPRPTRQSYTAATHVQRLTPDFSRAIDALGQRAGSTAFMTLSAAFALLLGSLAGSRDVLFGSVIANRTEAATEALIGCFQNGLLLRVELGEPPRFHAVLDRVRTIMLEAYQNQRLPTETIVEQVFDKGRIPQVIFALQESPDADRLQLDGIDVEGIDAGFHEIKYDFVLEVFPRDEHYEAMWSYRTDLFEETTIAAMASTWAAILEDAIDEDAGRG